MPTKKKPAPRNPNRASKSIWHAHDGTEYPIVDLEHKASIYVTTINADVRKAIKCDPNNCAIAYAWKRTAGVPVAQIGCTIAYLPMIYKGKMVAMRCKVPKETRDAIARFDKTGKMPAGGFRFVGISPNNTMTAQRNQQKRFRQRWGTVHAPNGKQHKPRYKRNASRRAQTFRGK